MQLNDTSTQQGIIQMIDTLCSTQDKDYPLKQKILAINNNQDVLHAHRLLSNKGKGIDDSNFTVIAQKTLDIVEGQDQYSLPEDCLMVERLELKHGNNSHILKMLELQDINAPLSDREDGRPLGYYLQGQTMFLDRKSDYSQSDAFRIWYTRDIGQFSVTGDDTRTPGYYRVLHQYLAYGASVDYCMRKKPERVQGYQIKMMELLDIAKKMTGGFATVLQPDYENCK